MLAQGLARELGQSVVVDAQGRDAATGWLRGTRDGRALLLARDTLLTLKPPSKRQPTLGIADLAMARIIGEEVLVLACDAGAGIRSVADWQAKTRDGNVKLGVLDDPAQTPLGLELARRYAPHLQASAYRSADALRDAVAAREIDCAVVALKASAERIRRGALAAVAVNTSTKVPQLPDVPTLGSALGVELPSEAFVLASPSGTPATLDDALAKAIDRALQGAELRGLLEKEGLGVLPSAQPVDAKAFLQARETRWAERLQPKR